MKRSQLLLALAFCALVTTSASGTDSRTYLGFSMPWPGAHNFRSGDWRLLNVFPFSFGQELSQKWLLFLSPQLTLGITNPEDRLELWIPVSLNYVFSPVEGDSGGSPYLGLGPVLQLNDRLTARTHLGLIASLGWLHQLSKHFVYRVEFAVGYRFLLGERAVTQAAGGPFFMVKLFEWGHWF